MDWGGITYPFSKLRCIKILVSLSYNLFENDKLILLIKIMIFNEDVFVTVSETKDEEVATTIKQASPPPTVEATQ